MDDDVQAIDAPPTHLNGASGAPSFVGHSMVPDPETTSGVPGNLQLSVSVANS